MGTNYQVKQNFLLAESDGKRNYKHIENQNVCQAPYIENH